ncbi:MAG: hypothetical protein AAF763_05575 [Pseudomonadota bacterium]
MTHGILEHVAFALRDGVDEAEFLAAAEEISRWAVRQQGFEYRCLTRGADGRWLDLRFWSSREAAERARERLTRQEGRGPFMRMIDPTSVEVHFRPVMARKAPAGLMLAA